MKLSRTFLSWTQAPKKANKCSKKIRKETIREAKTNYIKKTKNPKDAGDVLFFLSLLLSYDFCQCPSKNVLQSEASGKKGNAFSNRLELIWLKSRLKMSKISKCVFAKRLQVLKGISPVGAS